MSEPPILQHPSRAPLEALIARTAGLQPWRRVFHATVGIAIAALLHLLEPERFAAAGVLAVLAGALLTADLIRLRWRWANRLFFMLLRSFASPREATRVASSTWFAAGCAATVALFPVELAVPCILVLALADPLASYVGRRWGRRPLGSGTIEGSLTFLLAAFVVLILLTPFLPALFAALGATWVERARWPLDDNLTVPLATGALLAASTALPL